MTFSSSNPVKIAIIGGGLIGPRHAQSIISLSPTSAVLIALVDPAPHGPSIAASLNTTHFHSITSLLSSTTHKPDAAVICTPNHTHVPLSLQLIAAGIHVLVEKPMATSISEGLELISAAKEKGVKLLVGHHRRFNPYLLSAKKCADSGKLGKVIVVQGSWCLQKPDPYFDGIGEWRQNRKNGGVVCAGFSIRDSEDAGFDAEEGAAIILKFENGIVGTFILSDAVPSPWAFEAGTGENPMIPQVEKEDGGGGFYRIMGTKSSLSVPDLTLWGNEGKGWTEVLTKDNLAVDRGVVPFDAQMKHFVDVVRGGDVESCSGEVALSAMVVCEGVKRAIDTGKQVRIRGFEIIEVV